MTRLTVVCEGSTELEFCRAVLAPHLLGSGVHLSPARLKHSGGGDVRWSKLSRQLIAHLKSDASAYLTTLVDYYGRSVPNAWPAADAAARERDVRERVAILEDGMSTAVDREHTGRFIPYLQLYEFEALLFSDAATAAGLLDGETPEIERELGAILSECGEPELINGRYPQTPSRRLTRIAPGYAKGLYGALLAEEIGLVKMRAACPGFDRWVGRLEGLDM